MLAFLASHFPTVLSWAASIASKAYLGEKAKAFLKERGQVKAYRSAIGRALSDFSKTYPEVAASFFDEHFVRANIADELAKFFTRAETPDQRRIEEAFAKQFAGMRPDISVQAGTFLKLVERQLKSAPALQDLLNARQTEDSHRILQGLETGNLIVYARPAEEPVADTLNLRQVSMSLKAASQDLLSWPQVLDGGQWLERSELASLIERIDSNQHSCSLLLGEPGSGKSAILARLGLQCADRGWAVFGIKADQLPEELASAEGMQTLFDLPALPLKCLEFVARTQKVVLLVDQLDALSELVDLKTGRLRFLLKLIAQARQVDNVHIIASCRIFDRNYDKRLSSIDAEELTLQLPTWEDVESLLRSQSIECAQWPDSFRDILRVPQCLKLFLIHFSEATELGIFESYQTMLEHLWTDRLFGQSSVERASALLHEIAIEMAEREVMFVPTAKYDANRKPLDYLVAAGVLRYDHTGRQISFSHQTLFDFARARAFIAKEQSLSLYVLERQTGLFVRPKLWSALHYLRGSDPVAYEKELLTLWQAPSLRAHIKMLLIDFLGLQEPPLDFEVRLLRPVFSDPQFAPGAFSAIAGRRGWFDIVASGHLSAAMRSESGLPWSVVKVLETAWVFSSTKVLELISANWISDSASLPYAWSCLRGVRHWGRSELDVATIAIANGNFSNSAVDDLASLISSSAPDLAPELVAAQLKKQVSFATRGTRIVLPDDARTEQHLAAHLRRDKEDTLRQVLDRSSDWYQLPAVAEAAPNAYLAHVWPIVKSILEEIANDDQNTTVRYREDHLSSTLLEIDEERHGREYPLVDSLVYAVRSLAKHDRPNFFIFLSANQSSNSMTVHRLLALGLIEIAEMAPKVVLDYLLGDIRRLSLENFHEDERETKMLLRAVLPQLDGPDCLAIEQNILAADIYSRSAVEMEAKDRQRLARYTREFRLRLLMQFPKSQLSADTRSLVDSELRRFVGFSDERRESRLLATKSAMDAKTMAKASGETLKRFLAAFPDSTNWGDTFRSYGGSIEVSREFAQFAKMSPTKALLVIDTLDPVLQQRPAAYVIRELTRAELSDQALYDLILALDARGFDGDEFRECCADALIKRVEAPTGLPDSIVALLERWLAVYPLSEEETASSSQPSDSEDRLQSVLWGHGRMRILPRGSFSILNACFFGLIARTPVASKHLLDVLNTHLARRDRIEVWDALMGDTLKRLRWCEHEPAQLLLDQVFRAYPALLGGHAGALQVAHSFPWASPELTKAWMHAILKSGAPSAKQTYGELLALRSVLLKGERWCQDEIAALLSPQSSGVADRVQIMTGLTYGAVNLWKEAADRSLLKSILCASMDSENAEVASAALDWFRVVGSLTWDAETRPVLESFASGRSLQSSKARSFVLDRVCDVIDDAPGLVYQVAKRMLNIFKGEVGDLSTSSALESETLLSIAFTLQRQHEPHRSGGLELFEELLHYNAYKARDVLMDIDRRAGAATPITQLRRRRRTPRDSRKPRG